MRRSSTFLRWRIVLVILFLLPIPCGLALINVYVDPANIAQTRFRIEKEISKLVLAGKNVAINLAHADYDERALQSFVIQNMPGPLDVVVMGSSRSRQIYSEDFPGAHFYNLASAALNLEDFLNYYTLLEDHDLRPAQVILVLEHWMLDRDAGYTHWKTLSHVYRKACERMNIPIAEAELPKIDYRWTRYAQLLSPAYFQESLKRLTTERGFFEGRKKDLRATQDTWAQPGEWLQKSDGSAGEFRPSIPDSQVWEKVKTKDDGVSPLKAVANERVLMLEKFLDYIVKNHKTRVVFFLAPIHPYTYSLWLKNGKGVAIAEDYYRALAARYGLQVIGSYNPEAVGGKSEDFTDWVHPRRPIMQKLIANFNYEPRSN